MIKNQSKIRRGIDKARASVRAWFSAWIDNPLEYRYHYKDSRPLVMVHSDSGGKMTRQDIIWHKVLGYVGCGLALVILVVVTILVTLGAVGQ